MPEQKNTNSLTASGRKALMNSPELKERVQQEAEAIFLPKIQNATWLRKLFLKRTMKREIHRRINTLAPQGALYLG